MKEIVYADYEKMIKKVAWKFAKNAQHTEELIAEGNLEYVKALIKFDPNKSCFSTYLYNRLNNHFINLAKKWQVPVVEINDFIPANSLNVEKTISFKQSLENLSETAKEIINLVLDTPDDLYRIVREELKLNKEMIRRYLREKGWKFTQINAGMAEIANALNQL